MSKVYDDLKTCVIYNPMAGRGRAKKRILSEKARFTSEIQLFPTDSAGQAVDLTQRAIDLGYQRIIAAGGDGTVHEVANGILQAGKSDVCLSLWPLGSMNDYAFTLGMLDWFQTDRQKPLAKKNVDVGFGSAGQKKLWFVNSAGIGFNGMTTIESRKIRWLRGIPLYALALLKAMVWHFHKPVFRIEYDDCLVIQEMLAFSICLAQREGGFPLCMESKLDDGLFDCVYFGKIQRWEIVRYLPGLISGNLPTNHPEMKRLQASKLQIQSKTPICCHLDGEFLCKPEDQLTQIDIELQHKKLLVEYFEK